MWEETFKRRMHEFSRCAPGAEKGEPVSIKIRVSGGCFHREHSPEAYKLIDKHISGMPESDFYFRFEEHESGPELLVYLAVTTAGISLAKSIIDLVVAILKARSEGIKKGDKPDAHLELIVRRVQKSDEFIEEKIMKINSVDLIDNKKIQKQIEKSVKDLIDKDKGK